MNLFDVLTDADEKRARNRRINGAVTGIVTNNKDEDGLGRVKIEFPWLSEDSEGDWVRVVSFMAGKERGGFFLPEVGDEVLVVFEHGDVDYPYVIGALWSSEDIPPETNQDGKNNIKKITSRSGHEIIFNDDGEQQKEKLEIHTKAGHKIILDDSAGQEKIDIIDKTESNKITIDSAQNSINIESAMQLKIKSQTIDIEAGAMMTIKAGATLTIEGTLVKIN
jgi:uncharacterized protein involved in type VI secretion and phage assembly